MDKNLLKKLADYVMDAQNKHYEINKITKELYPGLSIEEAYQIQEKLISDMLVQGETIAGPKMGLTSKAKLEQMNVSDPVYGYVFHSMVIPDEGEINITDFIHPKAEPEIGFIMTEEVLGPEVTKEEVIEKTDFIFPAIEIIDSRYRNFDFTVPDVIADNTSAAGAVFGTFKKLEKDLDLRNIEAILKINGKVKTTGRGSAVLGHPAESVACLAKMLYQKGGSIKPGQPILTGGITAASTLAKGDHVEVVLSHGLGKTSFHVK